MDMTWSAVSKIRFTVLLLMLFVISGCVKPAQEQGLPDLNRDLELEIRLTAADFSIIESYSEVVDASYASLLEKFTIPETVRLEFAGKDVGIPEISPGNAVGMGLTNGRSMVVYLFDIAHRPGYGEIVPLALSHYRVPSVDLDIVLILVCFQYDTEGSNVGIGVRSVNLEGVETSAPFAVALAPDELAGKFFYDEFINGGMEQAVAGREDWDQGYLMLTRLDEETIVSTYLPWY